MPIANVCQLWAPVQGSGAAVTMPSISTSPCQHSGDAGQRPPAPGTAAAGQWLVVVAIPNVPIAPAGPLLAAPALAGARPAPKMRAPMIPAATATTTRLPPAAAVSATVRRRRVRPVVWIPWPVAPGWVAGKAGAADPAPGSGTVHPSGAAADADGSAPPADQESCDRSAGPDGPEPTEGPDSPSRTKRAGARCPASPARASRSVAALGGRCSGSADRH
jgi:hypothetical protein